MRMRVLIPLAAAVLWTLLVLWMNLCPVQVPAGPGDLRNPFAEPWFPNARTQWGWPADAWRRFDVPSEVNSEARFDALGFAVDAAIWLVGLGVCVIIAAPGLRKRPPPAPGKE
jgi:hypothetical protein